MKFNKFTFSWIKLFNIIVLVKLILYDIIINDIIIQHNYYDMLWVGAMTTYIEMIKNNSNWTLYNLILWI